MEDLDSEDSKIIVLARSARARLGTLEGAAVRDDTGRTYVAATITLASITLSALQAAVVVAASSGADRLEAAALVSPAGGPSDADLAAVRDLGGSQAPIFVAGPDGAVRECVTADRPA